jgi:hypothetical protein
MKGRRGLMEGRDSSSSSNSEGGIIVGDVFTEGR